MDRRKVGTRLLRTSEERCRRNRHLGARSGHDELSPQTAGEVAFARDGSLASTARADAEALFGIRSRRRVFPGHASLLSPIHGRGRIRDRVFDRRYRPRDAMGLRVAARPIRAGRRHRPRRQAISNLAAAARRARSSRFCEVRAIGTKWLRRTPAPASSIWTMACWLSRCIRR